MGRTQGDILEWRQEHTWGLHFVETMQSERDWRLRDSDRSSVARQHRMVVFRMTLVVRMRKRAKLEQRIKWWKL